MNTSMDHFQVSTPKLKTRYASSMLSDTKTKRPAGGYLTFIVKPDCLSQGKGIFITNNIEDAIAASNNPTNERIVV